MFSILNRALSWAITSFGNKFCLKKRSRLIKALDNRFYVKLIELEIGLLHSFHLCPAVYISSHSILMNKWTFGICPFQSLFCVCRCQQNYIHTLWIGWLKKCMFSNIPSESECIEGTNWSYVQNMTENMNLMSYSGKSYFVAS